MNREEKKRLNKEAADRLAEETLNKMKENREQRRASFAQAKESFDIKKTASILIFALCLFTFALGCYFFISASSKLDELDAKAAGLEAQIKAKQEEIDNFEVKPVDVEYVQETLNTCMVQGNNVAELQNNYRSLLKTYYSTLKDADLDAITENSEALSAYLTKGKGQGYWYSIPSTSSSDLAYTWEFCTTYQFTGSSIPVIWVCYEDGTQNMLAYATGTYNMTTQKFSDVESFMTNYGEQYQQGNFTPQDDCDNPTPTDAATPTDSTEPTSSETTQSTDPSLDFTIGDSGDVPERPSVDVNGDAIRSDAFYSDDLGRYIYMDSVTKSFYDAITHEDVTDGVNGKLSNFHWDESIGKYVYTDADGNVVTR